MRYYLLLIGLAFSSLLFAQQKKKDKTTTQWLVKLERNDSITVNFNMETALYKGRQVLIIKNGNERLRVDSVRYVGDSVFIKMPVFESSMKARIAGDKWEGLWQRGSASKELKMRFTAVKRSQRFPLADGKAAFNISGRWAVRFAADTGKEAPSIGEFKQQGSTITGTFLTPTGDYRFLEGVVSGNQLLLSGFDGGHAVLFTATIANTNTLSNGMSYSGPAYKETWSAVRNTKASVKIDESAMYMRPGESSISFRFPDLDSNLVSLSDARFRNKVVIVQLMGSWCPNCMDETEFLSNYYRQNKQRGVEVVALAYEYSTDFVRSRNSLLKFVKRFNVQYPVLFTGVAVSDTLRTQKTLPQVTPIRVFPSSIIIDKKGIVRKLDNGFIGPGTGQHFEVYKKEFYRLMDALLGEH